MDSTYERPPYGAYAAIMGVFAGGLAAAGMVARSLDRDPQCRTALDFVVLGAASFKAAHTLSHDEVTSFIREPFVRGRAHEGVSEEPVEGGLGQAIGSLSRTELRGHIGRRRPGRRRWRSALRPVADVVV